MTGYVIGPWVRGARFYGRDRLLATLLACDRRFRWVAGCRRVGKTSLLRQLELLAGGHRIAPLVWDLQGADDADELRLGLEDALLDAAVDIAAPSAGSSAGGVDAVRGLIDAFSAAARDQGRTPLLLIDEAEELLTLATSAPDAVAGLGTALTGAHAPHVVMTSSVRLARLAAHADMAGWLAPALDRPLWIGPLEPTAARALVRQAQQGTASQPGFDDRAVEQIVAATGGQPYLTQLLAKRASETGDVGRAVASLAGDPAVRALVAVDLELLESADRAVCEAVAAGRPCDPDPATAARLAGLGLIRSDPAGGPSTPGHAFL